MKNRNLILVALLAAFAAPTLVAVADGTPAPAPVTGERPYYRCLTPEQRAKLDASTPEQRQQLLREQRANCPLASGGTCPNWMQPRLGQGPREPGQAMPPFQERRMRHHAMRFAAWPGPGATR